MSPRPPRMTPEQAALARAAVLRDRIASHRLVEGEDLEFRDAEGGSWSSVADALTEALALEPVEPGAAPQEQAVEAAAKVQHQELGPESPWDELPEGWRQAHRLEAEPYISAALTPLMAPIEALADEWDYRATTAGHRDGLRFRNCAHELRAALASIKGEACTSTKGEACSGCCPTCDGTGYGGPASGPETNGRCADCRGTGHDCDHTREATNRG